jgi:cytochrome P450
MEALDERVALEERDYFTDYEILKDPYEFFEAVRAHGPIFKPESKDYLIVTGYPETLEILKNHHDFSASIGLAGAALPLPFEPEGSDITDQIEENLSKILGGDFLVNLDDDAHTQLRALVNKFFVPARLKANEEFIKEYSDELVRKAVAKGSCELMSEIATPFVTLVIADLLGVPVEDRRLFMETIANAPVPGSLNAEENDSRGEDHPMILMGAYFARYLVARLTDPREDILTELAHSTYPNGNKPDVETIASLACFMFGAGQDTSAKILGSSMKYITDQDGLQERLRAHPELLPQLFEEVLRIQGSAKQTARVARRDTKVGDMDIPAGTRLLLAISAANRDPRRWERPQNFELGRPKIVEHVGFGRGKHVCAGAPLARVEVRILLEKLLAYTSSIELDEAFHGPKDSRTFDYEPSFIVRGLTELHLKLTPSPEFVPWIDPA